MSWFFAYIGGDVSKDLTERFRTIHATPSFLHQSTSIYIAAGGISETLRFGTMGHANELCWVSAGAAFSLDRNTARAWSTEDWGSLATRTDSSPFPSDGHFVFLETTGPESARVFSDTLGLRTAYFAKSHGGVLVSTRFDWLCAALDSAVISFEGLGPSWLAFNRFTPRLPVEDIVQLGPGGSATIFRDQVTFSSEPWPASSIPASTEDAWSVLSAFSRPIKDRSLALGLSGGFDSRVLLANLLSERTPFRAFTVGPIEDPDVRVARAITSSMGIAMTHLGDDPFTTAFSRAELSRYVSQVMLCEPVSSVSKLQFHDRLQREQCTIVDGGLGELVRRQYLNRLLLSSNALADRDALAISRYVTFNRGDIFQHDERLKMQTGLQEELVTAIAMLPDSDEVGGQENLADLFALRTRVPYWAGVEQARSDAHVLSVMPFAQPSFLRLALSLPLHDRRNGRFLRTMVLRNAPELARFPLSKNGTTHPFRLGSLNAQVWTRVKNRVTDSFKDSHRERFLALQKELILDTLRSSGTRSFGAYDLARVDTEVEGYFRGVRSNASFVDWWFTFELWRSSMRLR